MENRLFSKSPRILKSLYCGELILMNLADKTTFLSSAIVAPELTKVKSKSHLFAKASHNQVSRDPFLLPRLVL